MHKGRFSGKSSFLSLMFSLRIPEPPCEWSHILWNDIVVSVMHALHDSSLASSGVLGAVEVALLGGVVVVWCGDVLP